MKIKNKEILEKVEIFDAANDGNAVGRSDNDVVVFVPFAAPGDVVDIQITRKKKSFKYGKIIKFHKYSEHRVEPVCEHYGLCGGCKWQHIDYNFQLQFKQKQVKDALERIGHISINNMMPIIGADDIYFYRNKLEFTFCDFRWMPTGEFESEDKENRNLNGLGFHLPNMFDRVININKCHLQPDPSNSIRNFVKEYADNHNLEFYNIKKHTGFLRNLTIRMSNTGGLMVVVIVNNKDDEKLFPLLDSIHKEFPEITSLMYCVNSKFNDDYSDQEVILYKGNDHLVEQMDDLKFIVGPKSFYQTNHKQAYKLYSKALEFANLTGNEIVYDLYTGTGTIANFVAPYSKKVIGIEIIEQAIENAKENAKLNNLNNTFFVSGDMAKILTDDFIQQNGKADVVITDPPRAGMHTNVINQLLKLEPNKIVYVSCNPSTQARDIELLSEKYTVEKIQPIDMFPQTKHVETIALLSKLNTKHHLDIEIDEDELSEIDFSKDATYGEIKKYVLDKYGLKVSSLYIAQVKRKHGLIERENYNISKKENQRVPNCPEEKEKAIEDALEYFGMVKKNNASD